MPVTLTVRGAAPPPRVVRAAFRELRAADRRFSTYRAGSDVSRIAAGDLSLADAHPDVREVLARCGALRQQTGGAFDAYATGRLDSSGLVKGWAADRAAAVLTAAGVEAFCLDVGGDAVVRGGPWRVGVRTPYGQSMPDAGAPEGTARPPRRDVSPMPDASAPKATVRPARHDVPSLVAVLVVTDGAVATSGRYERGDHIVDPRTGAAATALRSATVVAGDLATADAWATAAFVDPGCLRGDLAALLIDDEGVLTTPALDRYRPSSSPYCAA